MTLSCPACGGLEASTPAPVPDREYGLTHVATYARCQECGTLFQHPMPTESDLAAFYPDDYHSMTAQGAVERLRHDVRLRRLRGLASGDGPVLDFGCGNGAFLRHAASQQPEREYYGFEIAASSEVVSFDGGSVTIVRGDLDALVSVVPPLGVITMNHVIEHLPDPASVVGLLADMLRPGGLLEGQTPAADSLEHRVFGTRWSGYHSPRHTVVFSRRALVTVLTRAGMADVTVKAAFNPAGIAVSLASMAQRGTGGRVRRQGAVWLGCLAMATLLAPVDLLFDAPGIVDFSARAPGG